MPIYKRQMLFNEIEEHLGFSYNIEMLCEDCGKSFSVKALLPLNIVVKMRDAILQGEGVSYLDRIVTDYYKTQYPVGLRLCRNCKRKKGFAGYEL